MIFALFALTIALVFADADWQPLINAATGLVSTATLILGVVLVRKQIGNDRDTKVAKDAGLATAATNGVSADVLPEVGPMQRAVNGGALASRVAALETQTAAMRKQIANLPALVREAIRDVRDEAKPGDGRDAKPLAGG